MKQVSRALTAHEPSAWQERKAQGRISRHGGRHDDSRRLESGCESEVRTAPLSPVGVLAALIKLNQVCDLSSVISTIRYI